MKKILFLCILISTVFNSYSQSTLDSAQKFNFSDWYMFNAIPNSVPQIGPDYGCLAGSTNMPIWFYFVVCGKDSGTVSPRISIQASITPFGDKLIIWGPFDDTINIANKLTASNIFNCYTSVSIAVDLDSLQVGKIYYGMIAVDAAGPGSMSPHWRGSYWLDNRCGLCNDHVSNYKQDICMVTLDTITQKNMIIWEKKFELNIASYNIYRETIVAGQFDSIGNVPVMNDSYFIDMAVNPFQRSYRYRIAGIDSCGNTVFRYNNNADSVSTPHATIHTAANPGFNGEVNLSWNAYQGFSYTTFYINRGSSPTNLQVLDSVASTSFSYTDFAPPSGTVYYSVTVKSPNGCSPDGGTTVYMQAMSNLPYAMMVSVDEFENQNYFSLFPNPTSGKIYLHFMENEENVTLRIFDFIGKQIYFQNSFSANADLQLDIPRGTYIAELMTENGVWTKKVVVN